MTMTITDLCSNCAEPFEYDSFEPNDGLCPKCLRVSHKEVVEDLECAEVQLEEDCEECGNLEEELSEANNRIDELEAGDCPECERYQEEVSAIAKSALEYLESEFDTNGKVYRRVEEILGGL